MPRRIHLELPAEDHPDEMAAGEIALLAAQAMQVPVQSLQEVRLHKYSFDARARHMRWVLTLEVWEQEEAAPPARVPTLTPIAKVSSQAPKAVVIGAGPAGLFAALDLLCGGFQVVVLERGKSVQDRRRDVAALNRGEAVDENSNYCFGEGGAGTYSDGKLYTRSGDPEAVREILEILVQHGAPESILTSWRPHVGSNRLPKVIEALRASLVAGGCDYRLECKAESLRVQNGRVTGVRLHDQQELPADLVVLATGHSSLQALQMATEAGAPAEAKGFALGVRVEHAQKWLDRRQYHGRKEQAHLPPSFYELKTACRERGVYSFCMCPGGWVVPSQTLPESLVVNGMSLSKRDSPYANSGIVVSLEPKDWCGRRGARWGWPETLRQAAALSQDPMLHEVIQDASGKAPVPVAEGRLPIHPAVDPFFGIRLQRALEALAWHAGGGANRAPAQRLDDFVAGNESLKEPLASSYLPGLKAADFRKILPKGLWQRLREGFLAFDAKIPGFLSEYGQMIGVETRTSSPVRLLRDTESLQSPGLSGLYPCGEGAGYAGGIISAALDGRRVAQAARLNLKGIQP
ncbi:MAG: FAD-binding protein [Planctomycetota bacterium]|nr:MAG: FAD-binding protein [Planctomycetota bacterium]